MTAPQITCPHCLTVQVYRPEQAEAMAYKCVNCDRRINAWKVATQLKTQGYPRTAP